MTNYDMDTDEGMENAMRWMQQLVDTISDGGVWGVPRSNSIYKFDKKNHVASRLFGGEPGIERVLQGIGYAIDKGEQA